MFGSTIGMKSLARLCRSLGVMLHSGVDLMKAFQTASRKTGDARVERATRELVERFRRGESVADAFRAQDADFPPLMVDLMEVADQTGTLPETLSSLADHYENMVRLRQNFVSAIIWPIFQLLAAIGIIALLIYLLGAIAQMQGGKPFDILGLGLLGASGAAWWLASWAAGFFTIWLVYQLLTRGLSQGAMVHRILLAIPVLGPCLTSLAVARFAWSFALTQDAGMSIEPSLDTSLRASGNLAFAGAAGPIIAAVNSGEELTSALEVAGLFPEDVIEMIRVGEQSGTVPEQLRRLSPVLEEQARRSLQQLTTALAWLIWTLVAGVIIMLIFKVAFFYIGMINDATKGL
jgi:type IV pilus assembly protein PilC